MANPGEAYAPSYTLGGLKIAARQLLREVGGVEAADDVLGLDTLAILRTDEVAALTDTCWRTETLDIAAGQARCQADRIYSIVSAQVLGADGLWHPLAVLDPSFMDRRDGIDGRPAAQQWQNLAPSDPARIAVVYDGIRLDLSPPPSATRARALRLSGYATPGGVWFFDPASGAPQALIDAHPFPLASWSWNAVVFGVALDRAAQWKLDAAAWLQGRYEQQIQLCLAKAGKVTPGAGTGKEKPTDARRGRGSNG
jgi:hypothetical protein